MKKYEFTGETMQVGTLQGTVTLRRIRAAMELGSVKAGDLGGWIEGEGNLSHDGRAWVFGSAYVYGNAKVYGDAQVYGRAKVFGNASVYGRAEVFDKACVYDSAKVHGSAKVFGNVRIRGGAQVCGGASVFGNAEVSGGACICGSASVLGNARIHGSAEVHGNAQICGDADVSSPSDVMVVGAIGSRDDFTTFFREKGGGIGVRYGCFLDGMDEFLERVDATHGSSKHAMAYRAAAETARLRIGLLDRGQKGGGND